ncbi:DivIVA domain-containing protein [Klenkia terrae]
MDTEDVRRVVFRKPPIGKRGYAEAGVDEFLDQVAASFPGAGGTGGIELNGAPLDR